MGCCAHYYVLIWCKICWTFNQLIAFIGIFLSWNFVLIAPSFSHNRRFLQGKSGFRHAVIAGNYRGSRMRDDALIILADSQDEGAPGMSPAGGTSEVRWKHPSVNAQGACTGVKVGFSISQERLIFQIWAFHTYITRFIAHSFIRAGVQPFIPAG